MQAIMTKSGFLYFQVWIYLSLTVKVCLSADYFGSGTIIAVSVTSAIILVAICILMFVLIRKQVAKAEFRRNCDTETPHSVNDFPLVKHDGQTAWRHDNGDTGGRQGHRRRSNDYDHDANND